MICHRCNTNGHWLRSYEKQTALWFCGECLVALSNLRQRWMGKEKVFDQGESVTIEHGNLQWSGGRVR